MKNRLTILIQFKGLTANRLAEMMDIQPSSISHIISGRNNPSFDFIAKLLKLFPDINPKWLILGEGNIYPPDTQKVAPIINDIDFTIKAEAETVSVDCGSSKEIERIIVFYADKTFDQYDR